MRRLTFVAFAGAIALSVVGCSSEPEATSSPTASTAPTTAPAATPAAKPGQPATSQRFNNKPPLVAQKPGSAVPNAKVSGLIQSTNGEQRAVQVQKAINGEKDKKGKDPFASFPVKVTGSSPATSSLKNGAPKPPVVKPPSSRLKAPTPPTRIAKRPVTSKTAALPPKPSTDLAEGIQVTGVVQIGRRVQAIVNEPGKSGLRVRAGQRLAGGQVLVKRIEMGTAAEPIVILEQNGVEVRKSVDASEPTPGSAGKKPVV